MGVSVPPVFLLPEVKADMYKISSPIRITQLSFPFTQFIFVRIYVLFCFVSVFFWLYCRGLLHKNNSQIFTREIVRKMLRNV